MRREIAVQHQRKVRAIFAIGLFAIALSAVHAQDLTFQQSVADRHELLLLPHRDTSFTIRHEIGDLLVKVTSDDQVRTYRVRLDDSDYVAYADLNAVEKHLIFDPTQRRFRTLTSSVIVEPRREHRLEDLVALEEVAWFRAYPALGISILRLSRDTNPTTFVKRLRLDPRVVDATVTFEDQFRRFPGRISQSDLPIPHNQRGPQGKDELTPSLFISSTLDFTLADPTFNVSLYNLGAARTGILTLRSELLTIVPDETTESPDDTTISSHETQDARVLPLDGKGSPFQTSVTFASRSLEAGTTYFVIFNLYDGAVPSFNADIVAQRSTGFTLDHLKRIQHTCNESGQVLLGSGTDPLQAHQWHLANSGQSAFAAQGGVVDEDMRMTETLSSGPTGVGVKIAVVDTGLELCHPDLSANVEPGASYNFNATHVESTVSIPWLFRQDSSDPFNFDPTHGHGSAVGGLISSTAENRVGGRGVAPGAMLRGYNMLNASDSLHAYIASLGASDFQPISTDVDIFNMSFGGLGARPTNLVVMQEQILLNGIRKLRRGNGVLYVKSAGNSFFDCNSLTRDLNEDIGCMSSIADAIHSLPYVIVVGAHNADGVKSSYSSAGADIWVSAPGGEFGTDTPALITVDPMGPERGFTVLNKAFGESNALQDDDTLNPHGDYTSVMNGTSAAAPNTSGAIAILLEENPAFTWRDVKHILANSARRLDSDIESVELTIDSSSRTVRLPWTENAAGYAFHNWYGFGAVAVDDALAFAAEYKPNSLGDFRESGWFELNQTAFIPDNDVTGVSQTQSIEGLAADANIEAVVVEMDLQHAFPNDLGIHLVSPAGTRSVISQVYNETLAVQGIGTFTWRVLTNAFYGENPQGDWRLELFDADTGDVGHLLAWRLRIYYGRHTQDSQ